MEIDRMQQQAEKDAAVQWQAYISADPLALTNNKGAYLILFALKEDVDTALRRVKEREQNLARYFSKNPDAAHKTEVQESACKVAATGAALSCILHRAIRSVQREIMHGRDKAAFRMDTITGPDTGEGTA